MCAVESRNGEAHAFLSNHAVNTECIEQGAIAICIADTESFISRFLIIPSIFTCMVSIHIAFTAVVMVRAANTSHISAVLLNT